MKELAKKIFEKATTLKIIRKYPFGVDKISDITTRFPGISITVIVDVGANIGQSAKYFSTKFPTAKIYSIEPSDDAFRELKKNIQRLNNVKAFQYAIGQIEGEGFLVQGNDSSINKVIYSSNSENISESEDQIIKFISLSKFCVNNKIDKISYLKIDTEGFDSEVLKSGESLLLEKKIDFIEVEAGMHKLNTDHVPFNDLHTYLQSMDYYLFGIYEQYPEWKLKKNCLRRCNPVYVAKTLI